MLNILKLKKNNVHIKDTGKSDEYTGDMRHYVPATKEWFNSVYSFNKNSIKSLPSTDIYVTKLIKSYFNLFNTSFEKKAKIPFIRFKKRRLKMSRIHVGKPEFKHTNDKVIITLYVFNQQLINYIKKINKIKSLNYFKVLNKRTSNKNIDLSSNFNKMFVLKTVCTNFIKDLNSINTNLLNSNSYFNLEKLPLVNFVRRILLKLRLYLRIKRIIHFNKSKFNSIHIFPIKTLLEKIYGKCVEFNIVSLKDYRLNSSILTEIMATKLKDRNNRLLRVVTKVLRFNIPYTRRLQYPGEKRKTLNKSNIYLRNYLVNNYFKTIPYINIKDKKDISKNNNKNIIIRKTSGENLNNVLKYVHSNEYIMNKSISNKLYIKKRDIVNTVLDKIENKSVIGIRIEASGRLSKRLIASRSVFKMRQIGTTRNINSSFRKMSSVLLRGSLNSSLNYSRCKDKTRIGAFGLKGWVNTY